MQRSLGANPVFNRGEHSANRHSRYDTRDVTDWLADQLSNVSAKVIADQTGMGLRAAEAVKMGRNGLTMAHLSNMLLANDTLRARYFQFCGGMLEGTPEMVGAISRAINAIVQDQATRGGAE